MRCTGRAATGLEHGSRPGGFSCTPAQGRLLRPTLRCISIYMATDHPFCSVTTLPASHSCRMQTSPLRQLMGWGWCSPPGPLVTQGQRPAAFHIPARLSWLACNVTALRHLKLRSDIVRQVRACWQPRRDRQASLPVPATSSWRLTQQTRHCSTRPSSASSSWRSRCMNRTPRTTSFLPSSSTHQLLNQLLA